MMSQKLVPGYHTTAWPDLDLETASELLRGLGYGAMAVRFNRARISLLHDDNIRGWYLESLDRCAARLDFVLDADAPFLFDPWSDEVPGLMTEGLDRERRVMNLRMAIGVVRNLDNPAGHRRMVTFSAGKQSATLEPQQTLDRLAESVIRVLTWADQRGVELAIRPRVGHLVDSIGRYERLLEWVGDHGNLLLAADVGVMVAGGEMPVVDLLQRVGDRLGCVYLSDLRTAGWGAASASPAGTGKPAEPSIGGGHVSAARVVDGLAGIGFSGPVILELAAEERGTPAGAKWLLESVFGAKNC